MKRAIKYLILTATLAATACAPRRVIPDSKLQSIVYEMFLTNAYVSLENVRTDSIDPYTPILERYGYTKEDFFYTLGDFQKRKSARFSYIINNTIEALEAEADNYEIRVRNLNRIDSIALAECAHEVYFNPQVKVRRFRDTASLWLRIPVREGRYDISFAYEIDSLDLNRRLQSTYMLQRARGGGRSYYFRPTLQSDGRKVYSHSVTVGAGDDTLAIQLADYTRREERPYIRFDSIKIVHYPTLEQALARMDSLLMFYPEIVYSDSVRQNVLTGIAPPLKEPAEN